MKVALGDRKTEYWIKDVELPSNFHSMKDDEKWDYIYFNKLFHREDGPAESYLTGYQAWYLNGKWHRIGGPAIIWSNGYKDWCLNGKIVDEEIYQKIQNCSKEKLLVYMVLKEYKDYLPLIEYRLNL